MSSTVAHSGQIFPTRSNPDVSIGPHGILRQVVESLYTSFNSMFEQFGVSIPEVAMGAVALLLLLIAWSILNGIRNRKSFTLEDEEDGNISQVSNHMGSRILRAEASTEGSTGTID